MKLTPKQQIEIDMIKANPDNPVTQAAYARYVGVSRATINEQVRKGLIVLDKDGKVIPRQADLARSINAKPAPDDPKDEVARLKLREQRAKTEIAEAKAGEITGDLVSRKAVDEYYYTTCRMAVRAFENMGKHLAPDLQYVTDQHTIQQIIKKEVHKILDQLSADLSVYNDQLRREYYEYEEAKKQQRG